MSRLALAQGCKVEEAKRFFGVPSRDGRDVDGLVRGDARVVQRLRLVFLGLLALGSAVTCLAALNVRWPRLERVGDHLQVKLAQLASSIIAFTLGLSLTALCHSLLTITAGGIGLFLMIRLFDAMVVVGFGSAMLVARRRPPFDRWWVGVMFLVLSLAATLSLIFWGVK